MEEHEKILKQNENKFVQSFVKICKILIEAYEIFIFQKADIQSVFLNYMNILDEEILKSLKSAAKNTLLNLLKCVKGDSKKANDAQAFVPIFRVYTLIDTDDLVMKIIHDPISQELREAINNFIG